MAEVGEYHLLERVDLVLETHQVRDGFIPVGRVREQLNRGNEEGHCGSPFVWVINPLQCDVLLVFEETVEFWAKAVESELGKDELDVCPDQRTIACVLD